MEDNSRDSDDLLKILYHWFLFNFSRKPYRPIICKRLFLIGTLSRILVYGIAIADLCMGKKFVACCMFFTGLFVSFLNVINFVSNYVRYEIDTKERYL